jgi:hypothetical protein
MTDEEDRAVARALLELLVAGEPPYAPHPAALAAAGRRRKARTVAVGAAAVLTVAALAAVAALVGAYAPERPTYRPAPRPSVELVPPPRTTEPAPPPTGGVDVLTPAQEAWLVEHDTAVFRSAYRPPAGWRVAAWVPFLADTGITDEVWNGGVTLVDGRGRAGSVGVSVARRSPPGSDCLSAAETVPLPGGGTGHVWRTGGPAGQVEVCWLRPDGVEVGALTARGPFVPDPDVPGAFAAERPETVARLAALAADPRFGWPAG